MVAASVAGLACWTTGAFILGIVYRRWHRARVMANRKCFSRQGDSSGAEVSVDVMVRN